MVRALAFRTGGPRFETSLCHWFEVRKDILSIKCYTASIKSPFDGGTVRAQIKMGEGDVKSNPITLSFNNNKSAGQSTIRPHQFFTPENNYDVYMCMYIYVYVNVCTSFLFVVFIG